MNQSEALPRLHKKLIRITVVTGLLLLCFAVTGLLNPVFVGLYGLVIPLGLQLFDTLTDLRHRQVFTAWLIVAVTIFLVSLPGYGSDDFMVRRAAAALKAPLSFLIMYWLLNQLCYRNGRYLVNTYRQPRWYHEEAERKITGKDVLFNLILYATTFLSFQIRPPEL